MAKKSSGKTLNKWAWILGFSPLIGLLGMLFLAAVGAFGKLPSFEDLENPSSNQASIIYSADGKVLGKYYIQNRTNVKYADISPSLIDALIATEDERFYSHSGIDGKAILRAVFSGGGQGGGSTITQQLAKILFHGQERTGGKISRVLQKFKEWVISAKLERNYTKQEILTMYLNMADFGHEIFGVQTAAKIYFNKKPSELEVHESALLVGLLKAPTRYSPIKNPERSLNRRNTVINQMVKNKKITEAEAEKFKKKPLIADGAKLWERVQRNQFGMGDLAPYFISELKKDLQKWCKNHTKPNGENYDIYRDGLRIYTTIDSKMQRYAEESVVEWMSTLQEQFYKSKKGNKNGPFDSRMKEEEVEKIIRKAMKESPRYKAAVSEGLSMAEIEKEFKTPVKMRVFSYRGDRDTVMSPWDSIVYYKYFLQCGLMSMETRTGHVKAWVGGIDFRNFKFDHVRGSQRQVGSTFKPFVYAMAINEKNSPCMQVPNTTVCIGDWCPSNSSNYKEGQMMSLKEALAHSVNKVSAYLMKQYGPGAVLKFAGKLGIDVSDIEAVPAICLGTPDITVYEMVGAFNTFPNRGVFIKPQYLLRIEDKNGNILEEFYPERNEAMDEVSAWLMVELMKGVVLEGTAGRLRRTYKFTQPVGGKTGTTQNNSDGWFIGFTNDLTTGVWAGGEDRQVRFRSTALGQGANMALPTWAIFMNKVYADPELNYRGGEFAKPQNEIPIETNCGEYHEDTKEYLDDLSGENFDR
jgi:penicillin-binding protein 1A